MSEPHPESEREEGSSEDLDHAGSDNEPGEEGAYPGGDSEAGPTVQPGVGGYEGRDPATDMPRIPSAPESQKDPKSHDGAPDADEEDRDPGS